MGLSAKGKIFFHVIKYSELAIKKFIIETNGKLVKGKGGIHIMSSIKFL